MTPQFDDTYWQDLKHTAQEVDSWPNWKKGEVGISTPTTYGSSRGAGCARDLDESQHD